MHGKLCSYNVEASVLPGYFTINSKSWRRNFSSSLIENVRDIVILQKLIQATSVLF
jgi:hypothetical protein